MSNTIAISTATQANVMAAAANARAAEAKRIACQSNLKTYQANTPTVAEMRQYAECVDIVHPLPVDGGVIVLYKIFFIVALLGMAFGFWKAKKEYGDFGEYAMFGFLGFIFAPVAVGIVLGILAGIAWLFI